ncbi:MAG TPA: Ku protein [Gammaproteobacteria bacterium]
MAARAMWKADVCVGALRVPVKLYAAVQDRQVHFRLLHKTDLAPVKQQMVDPETDRPVPREQIRKGLEVDKQVYVLLTDEELAALEPEPSRDIHIEQVVRRGEVDERWFDRPYYLGPDGDEQGYFALAAALADGDRLALARWVMRKKPYAGALLASDGYLVLETLRHAEEIVHIESVRPPPERAPDKREIALAEQLIRALEDRFDPTEYRDEHREQVMKLIEAKARGKPVRLPKERVPKRAGSLIAQLQASLKSGGKAAHG